MSSAELRQKYLEFFHAKNHAVIPSASLIPENDPTVLFTTAGMHPLVPYLLGEKHPGGVRLTSCQKCVRTDDIDEVGDATHLTFFEMLGNWSLGDYFKKDAIRFSWEFLTEVLKFPKEKLAVSVFAGDADAPFDEEAFGVWRDEIGLSENRIAKLPKKNNWWGPAGQTGPCGPDTEMFYWTGEEPVPADFQTTCDDPRWVEIWNDVFMEFNKRVEGRGSRVEGFSFKPLAQKNVDTGLGLERVLAIIQNVPTIFETDLFVPIITKIRELSSNPSGQPSGLMSERIIADHLRAATFIIGDPRGVGPSNVDAGYVVRKLLRRAIRHARKIGIDLTQTFTDKIADIIVRDYGTAYPELRTNHEKINSLLIKEEEQFKKTLEKGEREITEFLDHGGALDGAKAFYFYETYGFPRELTEEFLHERNLKLTAPELFDSAFAQHQALSRTASAGKFKGGLADHSEATTALHTATHLLHAALRQVLGDHVAQKGSNITAERLRFDFTHTEKMTPEQIQKVEQIINEQIQKDLPVTMEEVTPEEAKARGAIGLFESKYGEKVKLYSIGENSSTGSTNSPQAGSEPPFSREICGGPHVEHLAELGQFKIQKEESSSAGVRRIKAVLIKSA